MTEEATVTFTPPAAELVEHSLRELEWDDRLTVYKMTASAGNSATDVYSLPAAILFMFGTKWDGPLLEPGYKGSINWVDMNELTAWVRESVGDTELADRIESDVLPLESYASQVIRLREIVSQRMDQYREVRAAAQAASGDKESAEQ